MDAKKNDGKMFDVAGYRNRAKLLLSTLLFFKSDRLRSLQFREKSHASFCYPPSLTGPVCRTKFTFSLRSNSFWRACVREYSNSSRTIQLCRARDISDIQTWRGIAFWYCFHHNGKHNVEMIRDKENGIARDGMISRNFPISTNLFLYFIIRSSLF